jgi:hypothetical protein
MGELKMPEFNDMIFAHTAEEYKRIAGIVRPNKNL